MKIQPDFIFLHSAWTLRPSIYPKSIPELQSRLIKTISTIKAIAPSSKIIIIGPLPRWHVSPMRTIYLSWITQRNTAIYQPADTLSDLDDNLRKISFDNHIDYISLSEMLCKKNLCISRIDADGWELISNDYGHLSKAGADFLARKLEMRAQSIIK